MKKIVFFLCVLSTAMTVRAQILHPVKWSYAAKRISTTEAVVFLKATIEDGWHIYSAYQPAGGPIRTSFLFNGEIAGKLIEPQPKTRHEDAFNMDVSYFEKSVIFQQKIKSIDGAEIKGSLTFMVCNDHQCLPPETVNFSIKVP